MVCGSWLCVCMEYSHEQSESDESSTHFWSIGLLIFSSILSLCIYFSYLRNFLVPKKDIHSLYIFIFLFFFLIFSVEWEVDFVVVKWKMRYLEWWKGKRGRECFDDYFFRLTLSTVFPVCGDERFSVSVFSAWPPTPPNSLFSNDCYLSLSL